MTVEGHYDPDDYEDPIKYRVNYDYSRYLSIYDSNILELKVQRNVVIMLDGTSKTFYTSKLVAYDSSSLYSFNFFQVHFTFQKSAVIPGRK